MKALPVTVILLFALGSRCLSSNDYRVGPQALLDECLTYTSAYGVETASGIASSGSMYFVTWMGLRAWAGGRIFGTRIAQDGTVLDPGGIHFTPFSYYGGRPSVCWNGSSFFVVYTERPPDPDGIPPAPPDRVWGVRVSPDGTVLDDPQILIALTASANPTAVSWDGTNHVVVWEDRSGTSDDLYMARVSAAGTVLDATPRPISARATDEESPQAASSPTGATLIVWEDARNEASSSTDVYGVIVDSSGTLIPSADGIPICTLTGSDSSPSVCWASGQFKVVWAHNELTSGSPKTIMHRRVTESGTLTLDPAPRTVVTGTEIRSAPRIVQDGTYATLITWSQSTSSDATTRDVWGAMVDNCGLPFGGSFPISQLAGSQSNQLVASAGGEFLSVWNDSSPGGIFSKLCGDRISNAGTLIPSTIDVATAPPYQELPSVAFSGQEYLACWMELKDGKRCVYAAFVDESGASPDPEPAFCIDSDVTLANWNDATFAHVVWNGQDYVVAWTDGSLHKAMRIKRDGTILDPAGIVVGDNAGSQMKCYPGLASDGTNCLIVHQIGQYVRAVLLARDGSIIVDRQIEDLGSANVQSTVRAYWTGQVYVLVKQGNFIQILDHDANPISSYTVPAGLGGNISLAVGETNCLLVWSENEVVRSRRLGLDGGLLDAVSTTVVTAFYDTPSTSVSWDGKHYLVFFHNFASASSTNYDFDLVRVTADNTVVDPAPLKFANSAYDEAWWAVPCAGPKGKTLVAYCAWEPEPYNALRIKGRFFYSYIDLSNIREALDLENGTYVTLTDRIATASFPGVFYTQDDQACGIRAGLGDGDVAVGDSIALSGVMSGHEGERMIAAPEADVLSHGNPLPRPLGMTLRDLGGTPPSPLFDAIDGSSGAYNVCLLVKVWGRVTYSDSDYFYIDDGSNLDDGSGHIGVRVLKPFGYLPPDEEDLVSVTGISGAEHLDSRIIRVIRAKDFVKL